MCRGLVWKLNTQSKPQKKTFCVFPLTGDTGSSAPSKDKSSPIGLPSPRGGHPRAGCANPAVNLLLPALLALIKPNEVPLSTSGAPTECGRDPGATWLSGESFPALLLQQSVPVILSYPDLCKELNALIYVFDEYALPCPEKWQQTS